jgi:hypothetical protein
MLVKLFGADIDSSSAPTPWSEDLFIPTLTVEAGAELNTHEELVV